MAIENFTTFGVGCIGAAAPEVIRLYNLRLKPVFRWSWGYLLFSIPFILLGGFVACLLEPSSKYAAFYAGVSTPVLISSIAKNSGVPTQQTSDNRVEHAVETEEEKLLESSMFIELLPTTMPRSTTVKRPSLFKQFLNAL
jgi:hypothetical protein